MSIAKQVRNENYDAIKQELGHRQQQVLDLLAKHREGLTRHEIALHLHLPINSVTGRVKELEELDLIENSGETRLTQYGKSATVVRVKTQQQAKATQQWMW